jgi:hypothetical protein
VQPAAEAVSDEQLIGMLVDRARTEGLQLIGEGGLLQQLTKRVPESALEGEGTDHLGYDKHDVEGRGSGNSRNGTRAKTVLTDVGPVEVKVPRDVAGTFEPQIVKSASGGRGRPLPDGRDTGPAACRRDGHRGCPARHAAAGSPTDGDHTGGRVRAGL